MTILNTHQNSSELFQIMEEAQKRLLLISPYLQFNTLLKESLERKVIKSPNCLIMLVTRDISHKLKKDIAWLLKLENVEIKIKDNLHAKCYMNEERAIISSMNLYDFSERNNFELGVLVDKREYKATYKQLINEVNNSIISSKEYIIEEPATYANERKSTLRTYQEAFAFSLLARYFDYSDLKIHEQLREQHIDEIIDIIIERPAHMDRYILSNELSDYSYEIRASKRKFSKYTIGKVLDNKAKNELNQHDQIQFENLENRSSSWYKTTQLIPSRGQIVAVMLNEDWFNEYDKLY